MAFYASREGCIVTIKPRALPYLKFVNGYQLVVMGVALPITPSQARTVYVQLRELQEVSRG